jgi:hypothetical protein
MPGKESESRLALLADTQSWDQKGKVDLHRVHHVHHAHQSLEGR